MGVSLERSILFAIVVLSCFYAWRASAEHSVAIKKVYHHKAVTDKNVELGSCVLYGDGLTKKSITEAVRLVGDSEERIFVISPAFVSTDECKQMIHTVNSTKNAVGYTLTIDDSKKPQSGLVLRFLYPKDSCIISCRHFDSIQQEKGIVFNVYNKSLVHNLKQHQEPIIRTAAVTSPIIFLDPGHGGSDAGAIGISGAAEKEVCLAVSLEVKKLLSHAGYTVYLSRDADVAVALDMRTYKAHEIKADLLVSIHANASENKNAQGVELFFLDPDFFNNQHIGTHTEECVIKSILKKRSALSHYLAHAIHVELLEINRLLEHASKDRGIKKAVSQVLLGAYVPAVLIELGFMTNMHDVLLLTNKKYQQVLAQSIAQGVQKYCRNMYL